MTQPVQALNKNSVGRSSDGLERLEVAVIGGGPGGIVALKEMLAAGVTRIALLEREACIGGLFSRSYDGLQLTSSAPFSMFSDFPIPLGQDNHFWTKDEAVSYWTDYANHFGITPFFRLNHEVTDIRREADGWHVELVGRAPLLAETVILATGNNIVPNFPDWHGQLTAVRSLHSGAYRNSKIFEGKNVVIVGGGESAADITLEIARVAQSCTISLRSGPGWIVPRHRGKIAADLSTHRAFWKLPASTGSITSAVLLRAERRRAKSDPVLAEVVRLNESVPSPLGVRGTFGTKSLGLAQAVVWHGARRVGGIVSVKQSGRELLAEDGARIKDVDIILFATGYRSGAPVLPEGLRDTDPRLLYKHIIDPDVGASLIRIGFARPPFGSQFPIMEMQARFAASIVTGRYRLPSAEYMRSAASADADRLLCQFGKTGQRVRGLVDYGHYLDDVAQLIGCKPRLWLLLLTRPKLWMRVQYGAMQSSQYRLSGPGACPELAKSILYRLPLCPSPHVLRAGFVGLVFHVCTLGPIRLAIRRFLIRV
jgi:dimethylaniline monooxygenase (N-oxide forming)